MTRKEEIDVKLDKLRSDLAIVRGSECEVNTRIVGYYRNVKNFNIGKVEEYKERKEYIVP